VLIDLSHVAEHALGGETRFVGERADVCGDDREPAARPCSPARAASIEAFRASRRVRRATAEISRVTSAAASVVRCSARLDSTASATRLRATPAASTVSAAMASIVSLERARSAKDCSIS